MDIALKTRKKYELREFKGFDFSSSPLNVASFRSVKGKNFIFENGINKKRTGYEELIRIEIVKDNLTYYPQINGIFEFSLENEKFLLCYAGKRFYKIEKNQYGYTYTDITFSSTKSECLIKEEDLKDQRVSMFKHNNSIFFVGAGKFICFKKYNTGFELRLVENNSGTYIPLTTINIKPDGDESVIMESYEERNVFNIFRDNMFICPELEDDQEVVFSVDSGYIDTSKRVQLELYDSNGRILATLQNFMEKDVLLANNGAGLVFGRVDSENGKITFKNASGSYSDTKSIKARFATEESELLRNINSCKIGTMFGVNGRMDRLFLTKEDYKVNADYHSECEDFTYFTESSQNFIGNEDAKIMAYSLLNDGTLAVQKEYINGEAGIFYRSSVYDVNFSSEGTIDYINTYFPINTGTIGEGVVGSYTLGNLGEDKLFLSQNGVYSLSYNTNLVSTNRYAKERSNFINGKLLKHKDLSEAVAIVYKNKYYLSLDNVVYIADPRFKTQEQTTQTDTYDYDWWYWENVPVRVWQVISNELWFGTSDGRICHFDEKYSDRIYQTTQEGDIVINYEQNKLTFNEALNVKEDNVIVFKNDVFALGICKDDIIKVEEGKVFVSQEKIFNLKNGRKVVAICDSQTLQNLDEYTIENIDYQEYSFEIHKEQEKVNIEIGDFDLHIALKDEKMKLIVVDSSFKIKYTYNDSVLSLVENQNSSQIIIAKILQEENVVCEWYTPMLDFGSIEMNKTLLKISLTTEPITNGKLTFGYRTKDYTSEIEGKGMSSFSFDNIDFTNFSFLTTFANSYTIDIKEDFNYIQFYFRSDTNSDCVIYDVSLLYKENRFNRGVE
ncbi:MAG: hypothetical protein IJW82_07330 [Clostridia bacterium]|nr:hypothetical protein [Clostridia bacterium]